MTALWHDFGLWAGSHPLALILLAAALPAAILLAWAVAGRRGAEAAEPVAP
jgi:hypothetical protein